MEITTPSSGPKPQLGRPTTDPVIAPANFAAAYKLGAVILAGDVYDICVRWDGSGSGEDPDSRWLGLLASVGDAATQDGRAVFTHRFIPYPGHLKDYVPRTEPVKLAATAVGDGYPIIVTFAYKAVLSPFDRFRVHATNCPDLARDSVDGKHGHALIVLGETAREIAEYLNGDFISEGSMARDEAPDHVDFLPCTRLTI